MKLNLILHNCEGFDVARRVDGLLDFIGTDYDVTMYFDGTVYDNNNVTSEMHGVLEGYIPNYVTMNGILTAEIRDLTKSN